MPVIPRSEGGEGGFLLEEGIAHEAVCTYSEVGPNPNYNPAEHDEKYQTRIELRFKVRDGEGAGTEVRRWLSNFFSGDSKALTAKYVGAIAGIEPAKLVSGEVEFDTDNLVGMPLRFLSKQEPSKKLKDDGTPFINNKVIDILPTKLQRPDAGELKQLQTEAAIALLGGEEVPEGVPL